MRRLPLLSVLLVVVCLSACKGVPLHVPTLPVQPGEEVIGPVEGKATGIMLLGFIPIGQNQRFEEAYSRAVARSGATRIVDLVVQEDWFWAYVLNGYTTRISGTAVREGGGGTSPWRDMR